MRKKPTGCDGILTGSDEIFTGRDVILTGSDVILTGSEGIQHNGGCVNGAVVMYVKHSQ